MNALDTRMFGRKRVRLVRQTELTECGVAAVAMVAHYHGLSIDLSLLRRHYSPSLRGASLRSVMGVADNLGLTPRAVRLPLEEIPNLHLPAILHWNLNHYVVVEQCRPTRGGSFKALVHDPAGRSAWIEKAQLSERFTGIALELRPSDSFEVGQVRERLQLSQLWRRMTGLKRALAQTLVLTAVLQAFVLASPYFMQISVDSAVPSQDRGLVDVLAIGFALFAILNVAAMTLRAFVLLSISSLVGLGMNVNLARKLLRLQLDWFEKRHTGDILSRAQSIVPIQQMITSGTLSVLLDGVMAAFTLLLMFFYSPVLSAIALAAFALYASVRVVTFTVQRAQQEADIVASASAQSLLIESIRGIATLRLFGKEADRHALWQTQTVEAINSDIRLAKTGIWQNAANTLIFSIENILVTWVAIRFVIAGDFSIGMVYAFFVYKLQFQNSATSLINQAVSFRMLDLHLERLSDIALASEDMGFQGPAEGEQVLRGGILLRGITFRYGPSDPLVLKGIDLEIHPGEHVAITGPSGCGKSTLVKILLGLVEPEGGQMLVDGEPVAKFGYRNYRRQIGAVLQKDTLFGGSLANNIALFDDEPDMERITASARAAAIHEDITQMPMQYETLVGEMGSSLSGGQIQRVLLARALYRQPRILVIDEGTSHLDAAREAEVNEAIRALKITRVVVAHRRETIAAASRVLHMSGGMLSEAPA